MQDLRLYKRKKKRNKTSLKLNFYFYMQNMGQIGNPFQRERKNDTLGYKEINYVDETFCVFKLHLSPKTCLKVKLHSTDSNLESLGQ